MLQWIITQALTHVNNEFDDEASLITLALNKAGQGNLSIGMLCDYMEMLSLHRY